MIPTILYVEDNSDIREITATLLKKAGYNVVTGNNGKEGLDLCKQYKFDLVITDIIMPVMDGNEFIMKLSASKVVPPVMALSYKSADIVPNQNIVSIALKPLTSQSLVHTIHEALKKNRAMVERGAA